MKKIITVVVRNLSFVLEIRYPESDNNFLVSCFLCSVNIIEKETKVERIKKPHHLNLLTCHSVNRIGNIVDSANQCKLYNIFNPVFDTVNFQLNE